VGAAIGVLALARLLSWLFRTWHDLAVALITGFVGGSLLLIWPWKDTAVETFTRDGQLKEKIVGFENWRLPGLAQGATWAALASMAAGIVLIVIVEKCGGRPLPSEDEAEA
jgi:putative membrane protein